MVVGRPERETEGPRWMRIAMKSEAMGPSEAASIRLSSKSSPSMYT